ncbi:MAG: hypothetical protein Q7T35_09055 [Nitrosomonas sp.]|nr:hypothetical protein [Nitrosomonas sp.]
MYFNYLNNFMKHKKKNKQYSDKFPDDELNVSLEIFRKRYGKYAGVIGTGIGLKIKNGQLTDELSIRVYVRQKINSNELMNKIPGFVYGRSKNGLIDYSKKLKTDVITLENPGLCCKSGTQLGTIGRQGALTLLFKNKEESSSKLYLLTCSHVVGDLTQCPPTDPIITSSCCSQESFLASTIANSTLKNNRVEYDIAIAELTNKCSNKPELEIEGYTTKIDRFFPSQEIKISMRLDCAFPVSNTLSAIVTGTRTSLPLPINGIERQFDNLFSINMRPVEGDSGGLLFQDSSAVGIIVAKYGNEGFFQPLEEAFFYLKNQSDIPISCF